MTPDAPSRVFTQTNDAGANAVVAYRREAGGDLVAAGTYATGGRGNGTPHLASQSSLAIASNGRHLLVANAGSGDVSVFAVEPGGLSLVDRTEAGPAPTSIAAHGDLVYVLHTGERAGIAGFRLTDVGLLSPLDGARRELRPGSDPAQVAFSPDGSALVVSERATDSLSAFAVGADGLPGELTTIASAGATPYGFDFTSSGALVVTEAAGGRIGEASASSYRVGAGARLTPVTGPVANTRSEVCWAAVSKDDRYAYVTNFGDGTISSYAIAEDGALTLLDPVAATTVDGRKGIRDEALTADGRFLYALHADVQKVFGWAVGDDGALAPIGSFGELPETVAGLAAV